MSCFYAPLLAHTRARLVCPSICAIDARLGGAVESNAHSSVWAPAKHTSRACRPLARAARAARPKDGMEHSPRAREGFQSRRAHRPPARATA